MYPLETWIVNDLGIMVPTSEHAYHSERFIDPLHKVAVADARAPQPEVGQIDNRSFVDRLDGVAAKRVAYGLIEAGAPTREDWEAIRVETMFSVNLRKFRKNYGLAAKLIDTGDMELIEGNQHGDRFWGVDPIGSTNGENQLGKVLMKVRAALQ